MDFFFARFSSLNTYVTLSTAKQTMMMAKFDKFKADVQVEFGGQRDSGMRNLGNPKRMY